MSSVPTEVTTAIDLLKKQLEALVGTASDFFVVLLVIGVLSMSIIQIVKDVLPARRWYQLGWLRRWVRRKIGPSASDGDVESVFARLIDLATAGDAAALGDLGPEQIGAQLNAAGRLMLDEPHRHEKPLCVLAAPGQQAAALTEQDDPDLFLLVEFAKKYPPGAATEPTAAERQRLIDARNRLNQRIQRNLDAIQIAMGSAWKRWLQWTAYLLTPAVIVCLLWWINPAETKENLFRLILVSLLGAFVAPIARDLVAALQGAREKLK